MPNDHRIDSDKIFIKDVFDWWFRVPEYQRPYVWGTDQVNDLLEDVAQAMAFKRDSEYFMGAIVLQKRTVSDGDGKEFEEYDLLDGQQRLTTCLMLHAVARDLAADTRLKESCRRAVFQEENPYDGVPERLRIIYDIRDDVRVFVNIYLKSDGGTADEDRLKAEMNSKDTSVRNMTQALLEIRRYFAQPDAPPIGDFFAFFRNKVLLIYVASTELDDAFRLFTVLNDRGIKLRGSDILKTQNLRALKVQGASAEDQKKDAQMWEEIEGELGEDFDVFLSHVRTILVKDKARLSLLQEFDENVYEPKEYDKQQKSYKPKPPLLSRGRATFDFIRKYHKHYQEVFSGSNHRLGNSWAFDNLITLMAEAGLADFWTPPVLHYRELFGEVRIVEFVRKLENKFSADWIARETPTARLAAMNAILKEVESIGNVQGLTPEQRSEQLLSSAVFAFNRDELFKQLGLATVYGRRYARYLLYKLDMIYGGPNVQLRSPKDISVEHILPQNPGANSQWCKDFSQQDRETWTDRLGNLVLITGRKNSTQGRLDFKDKKSRYFQSNIEPFPNSIRVLQNNSTWDLKALTTNHEAVLATLRTYYAQ